MNSTYKRMIELYNQMDCPYCGQKLNVSFQTAKNETCGDIVIPHSSCCEEGSQFVAEISAQVYQQVFSEECAAILNMP